MKHESKTSIKNSEPIKDINLSNLGEHTEQEVFDYIANHLLTQNEVSGGYSGCLYRGKNGLKCAAGCLMSDEEYNDNWESETWQDLIITNQVPAYHSDIISRMQVIHDVYEVYNWSKKIKELSIELGLEFKF